MDGIGNKKEKSRRQRRVEKQIKRILGEILGSGANDPRIGFVSVVSVEATRDLKSARVYVSVLGEGIDIRNTLEGIRSARSYFQREMGRRMSSRYTPVITFFLDDSIQYSNRIDRILSELKDKEDWPGEDGDECSPSTD